MGDKAVMTGTGASRKETGASHQVGQAVAIRLVQILAVSRCMMEVVCRVVGYPCGQEADKLH